MTRTLRQVTHSSHAGVNLDDLVTPELVQLQGARRPVAERVAVSAEGRSAAPAPYVVSFHGGPEGQEVPAFRSDYQALLSQGIGVFAPNVRGSSGFGKTFVNLDNGAAARERGQGHQELRRLPDVRTASPTRSASASPAARTAAT